MAPFPSDSANSSIRINSTTNFTEESCKDSWKFDISEGNTVVSQVSVRGSISLFSFRQTKF